ncbi:MAG: ATP synthase F1 subunit gamma [Cyclobacteriaceae bacterium]
MANLKEVKGRIQSVTSTQQITKAMKMVAAAKLRRAQDRITQMRPYSQKLTKLIQNVSGGVDAESLNNPYSIQREENNVLLVVVSSDRGLCGGFNNNAFKFARNLIQEKYASQEKNGSLYILPIGKKSLDYFRKRGYNVDDQFATLMGQLTFDEVREAAEYVMDAFSSGVYDKIEIIYNEFKNVAVQQIKSEQFLPIQMNEEEEDATNSTDYIFQPTKEFIFSEIIPKSLKIQFYRTLLESNASEQGARMTAMDQATDNAGELLKELRLTYNRTRQAAITKEILEIVGGAEALSQG